MGPRGGKYDPLPYGDTVFTVAKVKQLPVAVRVSATVDCFNDRKELRAQ
jgi:hypothetical protein